MTTTKPTVGILGAGKLGVTLAQLLLQAHYAVLISGSGNPEKIRLSTSVLTPGAAADWPQHVAHSADIIILALPLHRFREIPREELAGKVVIDAMNYWWEVDGPREAILPNDQSSSQAIQSYLPTSRVVKTFSHMGYHHLHDEHHASPRRALALAGDDEEANNVASQLVHDAGFDVLPIGSLANGVALEPGHPAFGANATRSELAAIISS